MVGLHVNKVTAYQLVTPHINATVVLDGTMSTAPSMIHAVSLLCHVLIRAPVRVLDQCYISAFVQLDTMEPGASRITRVRHCQWVLFALTEPHAETQLMEALHASVRQGQLSMVRKLAS
jgi:hypothetical protein